MRQTMSPFAKGAVWIVLCIYAQTLLGRGRSWGAVLPEGDFALLVLLSLSMGRIKGALLGALAGAFRDALSIRSFGGALFVLAAIGFLAGIFGERRSHPLPWQKILLIFGLFFLSDGLLLFLGEGISVSSIFPSALFATFMGVLLWCFLLSG